jgi:exosortase F-associated protein|nr:exosortase F system-associated protein [Flavobacterium sp.]
MFKNKLSTFLIIIAFLLLASIRAFESEIFYDPFISFYKSEYFHKSLPDFDSTKLLLNLIFRFTLNSLLSIFIIYKLFSEKATAKLVAYLYLFIGLTLVIIFYLYLNSTKPDYMILFYIRRFLIQPVFLVLFIPAFFYQKKLTNR